jgi:hypothetical protein
MWKQIQSGAGSSNREKHDEWKDSEVRTAGVHHTIESDSCREGFRDSAARSKGSEIDHFIGHPPFNWQTTVAG